MDFPILDTGAVAQYGSPVGYVWPSQIIRFLDGTDQRFLSSERPLRRWLINLRLLNELEIAAIEAFFSEAGGEYSSFTFPDPISGVGVPNCRVGASELISDYQGVDVATTSLWVVETNG